MTSSDRACDRSAAWFGAPTAMSTCDGRQAAKKRERGTWQKSWPFRHKSLFLFVFRRVDRTIGTDTVFHNILVLMQFRVSTE